MKSLVFFHGCTSRDVSEATDILRHLLMMSGRTTFSRGSVGRSSVRRNSLMLFKWRSRFFSSSNTTNISASKQKIKLSKQTLNATCYFRNTKQDVTLNVKHAIYQYLQSNKKSFHFYIKSSHSLIYESHRFQLFPALHSKQYQTW